jgi:hypothetical protein
MPASPKAFVCHSSLDRDVTFQLAEDLRKEGVQAWFAEWEIRGGDSLVDKINEGISGCDVFVVIISRNSLNSNWVRRELNAALIRRIQDNARLIPVRLDDSQVPPLIQDLHWISLTDYQAGFQNLVDDIFERDLRPPLGEPKIVSRLVNPYNLSELAMRVGKWLLEMDEDGLDYQLYEVSAFIESTSSDPTEVDDALHELEELGFIELTYYSAIPMAGARHGLQFALGGLLDYDPRQDVHLVARTVALRDVVEGDELQSATGLEVVRLNRAVLQIKDQTLAEVVQTSGTTPYAFYEVRATHKTRRFVSDLKG